MEKFNTVEQSILKTICYFDIFKYPLTSYECWRLLYDPEQQIGATSMEEVEATLKKLVEQNILKTKLGFWQLNTSADYYYLRQSRYRIFVKKWRRARRWTRLFTFLNSVRFIAIVNSLGYHNPEPDDDIDLFIITKSRQLWLTRWWLTGFAKLLGLRPTIKHQANGLCLSFYLSDAALGLKPIMINNDVYFHFWLPSMTVLFDDGVSKSLFNKNKEWLQCFPNLHLQFDSRWSNRGALLNLVRFLSRLLTLSLWEKLSKQIQLHLLPKNLAEVANRDVSVVINDQVLKFHNPDRREYYRGQWQGKLDKLGI